METTTALHDDDIGLVGRMIRVFYAPSETFAAVGQRQTWADWVVPLLLVVIVGLAAAYAIRPIVIEFTTEQMEQQMVNNPDMSDEERERIASMKGTIETVQSVMVFVAPPFALALGLLIKGALLLGLTNAALGGEIRFIQTLAIAAYSGLIEIIRAAATVPLILSNKTLQIHTGLGLLLPEEMLQTFLGRYLAGIEIFTFWQVCLASIGIAIIADIPARKAFIGVLVLWLVWLVIQAAFGGLGAMFSPGG